MRIFFTKRSFKNINKLHIACGYSILEGWLNTDIEPKENIVALDATKPLPFNENSLNLIFSEHFIEHISLSEFRNFLKEAFRVLKPNGVIRLSTPDLVFVLGLYHNLSKNTQAYIRWYRDKYHPDEKENKDVVAINGFFKNFGHQYLYDFESLRTELKCAGFAKIKRCKVGESDHLELTNIECHSQITPENFNALESLVVEAEKPK